MDGYTYALTADAFLNELRKTSPDRGRTTVPFVYT